MKAKRHAFKMISVCLAAALLFGTVAGCAGGDAKSGATGAASTSGDAAPSGKVYELSMTMHDPAASVKGVYYTEWADEIKAATNGQVVITVYAGGTLAAANAALDSVRTGAVDIGWIFTSFTPGQFPLSDIVTQPMLGIQTTEQATKSLWALYDQSPEMQKETSEYKLLQMYTNPQNIVYTANKPVSSLDTLKGLKLRSAAGSISDILTLWGAVPIMMGPGDVYESIEKKVIDGYAFEWGGVNSFKLQEVTKYYMDLPIYCGPFLLLMNKAAWDKIPADLQAIVEEHSGLDSSLVVAQRMQKEYDDVKTAAEQAGITACKPSDSDFAAFKAIANEYNTKWAQDHTTADFDAQKFMDQFTQFIADNA